MTTTTEQLAATDAASILATYEAHALPRLARLADIAEKVRDVLAANFADSEGGRLAAARAVSTTVDPALLREASALRMDVQSDQDRAVRRLDTWMEQEQAAARAAKAADPALATEEGRTARLLRLAEAQDLAGHPADELATEARRLLARGDARDAETRLNALRLGGARVGMVNALAKEVEAELDERVPHRKAAETHAYEARLARYRAQAAMIADGAIVRELAQADPTRPEVAVAKARARAARRAT